MTAHADCAFPPGPGRAVDVVVQGGQEPGGWGEARDKPLHWSRERPRWPRWGGRRDGGKWVGLGL